MVVSCGPSLLLASVQTGLHPHAGLRLAQCGSGRGLAVRSAPPRALSPEGRPSPGPELLLLGLAPSFPRLDRELRAA